MKPLRNWCQNWRKVVAGKLGVVLSNVLCYCGTKIKSIFKILLLLFQSTVTAACKLHFQMYAGFEFYVFLSVEIYGRKIR